MLRTQLNDLTEDEVVDARRQLNLVYDQFVARFGAINESANRRAFRGDPDLPLLCSLEEYNSDTKRATKAAIFRERTIQKPRRTVRQNQQPMRSCSPLMRKAVSISRTWKHCSVVARSSFCPN